MVTSQETETASQIATAAVINSNALIVNAFGYSVNLGSLMIILAILGIVWTFWRIQKSQRLDFADMLTKDGVKVSTTKVLQLIGGIAGTWVIIKTGSTGTLSFEIFAAYLTYVASIEGFSKFISAKYNYTEVSVKNANQEDAHRIPSTLDKDVINDAIREIDLTQNMAQQAEKTANSAVKTANKAKQTLSKGK